MTDKFEMIDRQALKSAKATKKRLVDYNFKPARSRRMPKPFDRLGPSANLSEVIDLGDDFRAVFIWRDGETLSRTAFYGHLLRESELGCFRWPFFITIPAIKAYMAYSIVRSSETLPADIYRAVKSFS